MGYFQVLTDKRAFDSGGLSEWSNTYTVSVEGGIDGEPMRSFLYWLTLAEQQLHLTGVQLVRVVVRSLPFNQPNGSGLRVFFPFGRDFGTRPTAANAGAMPLSWALHVKKQTGKGRSGHIAYRGVLHSCDLTLTGHKRIGLKADSDLCGARFNGYRNALLGLESLLVVPGPDENNVIVKDQRPCNGLFVGGPQHQAGLTQRHRYTKPKCLRWQGKVEGNFQLGADCLARLLDVSITIGDEIYIEPLRDIFNRIVGLLGEGKAIQKAFDALMEDPNGLDEKDKCRFAEKTVIHINVLDGLAKLVEGWVDEQGPASQLLKGPSPTRSRDKLQPVLDIVCDAVSIWDYFRTQVAFDPAETLLVPSPQAMLAANLNRGSDWVACDPATQQWLDDLKEWPTRQWLAKQFRGLLLDYGRKKIMQWAQAATPRDSTPSEEVILKEWPGISGIYSDSLSADPAFTRAMLAEADAFYGSYPPQPPTP